MEAGLMHFEEGALECLNPDLTVDDQAELLPYDKKVGVSKGTIKSSVKRDYALRMLYNKIKLV